MGDAVGSAAPGIVGAQRTLGTGDRARRAAWIDRNVRLFYLLPRIVGRRAQLCLRGPDGSELGWKDVGRGTVLVRAREDRELAHAILRAAGPANAPLPADDLPGVPLDIPSGRLLAQLRVRSAAILIGKEQRSEGYHRMYATFAWPGRTTVGLGHVDLQTGTRQLHLDGASGIEHAMAVDLLEAVAGRRPRQLYP